MIAVAVVLAIATAASAALTPDTCLARKRRAWGYLQACTAAEHAKQLEGRSRDDLACVHRFNAKLRRINQVAAAARVACHYRDNGDGTVTDYDSGLQWEKKTTSVGSGEDAADPHDVDNLYQWAAQTDGSVPDGSAFTDFLVKLNGCSLSSHEDGESGRFGFAGHCDWYVPAFWELRSILDPAAPGCDQDGPCIDPIFGPTRADVYWATTAESENAARVWNVSFGFGGSTIRSKSESYAVRAVRQAGFW